VRHNPDIHPSSLALEPENARNEYALPGQFVPSALVLAMIRVVFGLLTILRPYVSHLSDAN
jgi:hypothetical protein